ncbi:MAG: ATP-binding protein [Bacilli bacterium]|nr:ATP-binding protein [Bacilli bacterium]MDD3422091.1 ATP-binding protein [Bacilli bacterium]MDD4065606.1 ATP-binding protein [Bacilli bacterium]
MTNRIFRAIFCVATSVLIVAFLIITGILYNDFTNNQTLQLKDELSLAATATEDEGVTYLVNLNSERYRLTLINSDGVVIYDTVADESTMENHLNREEIQEALQSGSGSSSRYSTTLTEKYYYEATLLKDGTVLRISITTASVAALLLNMIGPLAFIVVVAIVVSLIAARAIAKNITKPLNELDLEHPLNNEAYEELAPLLNRINSLHRELDMKMFDLNQQRNEFKEVTDNMREGLVLLDKDNNILSINPAAKVLFGTDDTCLGTDFLTIDRKLAMTKAIERATKEGHSEIRLPIMDKQYQFDITRIQDNDKTTGAVILAFDVSTQAKAEQMRKEFSANVSHELKTPLQSIIGSAELLSNGLVKKEDTQRFLTHIQEDATRLLALVEDIIRLSQLDEGLQLPSEKVSLKTLTNEALSSLQTSATAKEVSISLSGDEGLLKGSKHLLYEIIYNICDNAIMYNVTGGSIAINIQDKEDKVILTVTDTGIGIPQDQINRVFERFYRVDKSHSKQSGGTGLGLSIVKHGVEQQHGQIKLTSKLGEGTTIVITLPKEYK